jgi:hypothetical protein
MITLRCPVCDREITADVPHRPFCSDRCRLIDLGRWLGQGYRIPADDAGFNFEDDLEAEPPPP